MKYYLFLITFFAVVAFGDTPPPNTVKAKTYSGDGATAITATGTALDVNVVNGGGTSTVNQGTGGLSPWLVHFDNTSLSVTGPLTDAQLRASPVAISGSITATNSANGPTNVLAPSEATQVGGVDNTGKLQALKVSASGVLSVDGSAFTQPISGTVTANQGGTWNINNIVGTVSLPTGASTAANQTTANSSLASIDGKLNSLGQKVMASSMPVTIASDQSSIPITAASLPLPAGASTAANQVTANASLSSIDSKLTAPLSVTGPLTDTQLRASAVPVSLASTTITGTVAVTQSTSPWVNNISQFGGSNVVTGTGASGAGIPRVTVSNDSNILATQAGTWNINNIGGTISLPTGASTSANQTTANTSLASIDTKIPALGQALMAASTPVVIASNQSTIPVSLASTTITGTVAVTQSTSPWAISAASLPLPTGAATETTLSAINTKIPSGLTVSSTRLLVDGSGVTQPVSGTVTANQGGAPWSQNITQVGGSSITLGSKTSANSFPVVVASDQASIPVTLASTTITSGTVTVNQLNSSSAGQLVRNDYSTTNVTTAAYTQLIASTTNVTNHIFIFDSSGQTLFLATGAAASEVNRYYIVPGGNGLIDINIPAGTRISVKAVTATASSGELDLTLMQ